MSNSKKLKLIVMGVDGAIPYLLDSFLKENALPNIANLIENGVKMEALSSPPCDTPTNWTTIATGASTEMHGITSFYLHIPGEPLDLGLKERSRTQLSRYCKAEYFWDIAEKNNYIPYVVNYPSGWPGNLKKGQITILVWPTPEALPRVLKPSSTYTCPYKDDNKYSLEIKLGINTPKSEFIIEKIDNDFYFKDNHNTDKILINDKDWSEWIKCDINTEYGVLPCLFKLKILKINSDNLKIQLSSIYNIKGWNNPDLLGEDIIKNVMSLDLNPYDEKIEYKITSDAASYIKYAQLEASIIGKTVVLAKNKINWNICFFHMHSLDSINHKELANLYNKFPKYSEEKEEIVRNNIENAYRIVDGLVGYLMKKCVDENTIFAFVSDHGALPSWKIANIPLALMKWGLLSYKWKSSEKKFIVDWKNTQAFPYIEPTFVWINLKGRDPNGIVKKEEYEDIQEQIIEALYSMRDPENNRKVVKLAIKRQEADYLGLNDKRVGDVIYFLYPPYQVYDEILNQLDPSFISTKYIVKPEVYDANRCIGSHVYYLPSEKFGHYSNSIPIILNGPGIKKGIEIQKKINLTDLSPTFAQLLNISRPRNATGRVLYEILN
ncbi:MAG: alkaline phosphatase family protein [Promethearchaeota archaeon]